MYEIWKLNKYAERIRFEVTSMITDLKQSDIFLPLLLLGTIHNARIPRNFKVNI